MSHFIKSGYWEKLAKGFNGYLNLDDLINSIISSTVIDTSIQDIQFIFGDLNADPTDWDLVSKARYSFRIESLAAKTNQGQCEVLLFVNGQQIDDFDITITDVLTDHVAITPHIVNIGDEVVLRALTLTSTPTKITGNLKITRL